MNPINTSSQQVTRRPDGTVLPGTKLNPHGRPVGSGGGLHRLAATVFGFLDDPQVLANVRAALRKEAEKNPTRFARQFLLPCTPHRFRKEMLAKIRAAEISPFSTVSKTAIP